jgi:hypothetical protein
MFQEKLSTRKILIKLDQRCPTHSPHVANGHLNVANGIASKHLKKLDV